MLFHRRGFHCALLLLAMFGALIVTGCPGSNYLKTADPREVGEEGAVGGSVYSLSMANTGSTTQVYYDHPHGATVTLTRVDIATGAGLAQSYQANTNVAGGFQFSRIPRGLYRLDVTATSAETNEVITGAIERIEVKGGIPSLMNNVLLGDPTKMLTFTGKVTEASRPAVNAIVTLSVQALPVGETNPDLEIAVIVTTRTNSRGEYHLRVPHHASSYWLTAHSDTSQLSDEHEVRNVSGNSYTKDFDLLNATNPILPKLALDLFSATLPAPSATASNQALVSRMAVARMEDAPEKLLKHLTQRSATTRVTRAAGDMGSVENDVWCYWDEINPDAFVYYVRGYHFYRSPNPKDTFIKIGTVYDPFQTVFIDNDPALDGVAGVYYTARAYGPNNRLSDPAPAAFAQPLPPINGQSSNLITVDTKQVARLSWNPVPGAQSYTVLVFASLPTYNTLPERDLYRTLTGSETTALINRPGTFYWAINAYNHRDPNLATAAAFSEYQRIDIPF